MTWILEQFGMLDCKPIFTPKIDHTNDTANDEDPVEKDTLYVYLIIKLLHLSNQTWPSSSLFRGSANPREFFKAQRNENNSDYEKVWNEADIANKQIHVLTFIKQMLK